MIRCEVCGRENDEGFRYCLDCGSELTASAPAPSAPPLPGLRAATVAAPPPPLPDAPPPTPLETDEPTDPSPTPIPLTRKSAAAESPVPLTKKAAPGTRPCERCGHPVPPEHAFCAECGAKVPAARTGTRPGPAGAEAAFALVAVRPDGSDGPRHPVAGAVTAGTGEGPVRLDGDPWVDPEHARFSPDADGLAVADLGSRTGTWLRLPPGEQARLKPGASLRLGHQRLRLEAVPPAKELEGGGRVWGSPDPGYRLRLVQCFDDGASGSAWPLAEGTYTIGREQGDLTFPGDGFVSGRHAQLTVHPDGHATFEDLGSSNGTYLRLGETTRLKAGDLVLLGAHLLRVDRA